MIDGNSTESISVSATVPVLVSRQYSSSIISGAVAVSFLDIPKTNNLVLDEDRHNGYMYTIPIHSNLLDHRDYHHNDLNPIVPIPTLKSLPINRTSVTSGELTEVESKYLNLVEKKIALHPERYGLDQYKENATFAILSNHPSANRLSFCGIKSPANPTGLCNTHKICSYCCWRRRTDAQLAYVPNYDNGKFWFLTGSFVGDLLFDSLNCDSWLAYWNAYQSALQALLALGLIKGYYVAEELAVNELLPARILPHLHCIVDSDDFTDTTVEEVKRLVIDSLKNSITIVGPDFLQPDIKVTAIENQRDLYCKIKYCIKTMKIATAYNKAWIDAQLDERARWQLNSQLTDLMLAESNTTRRRPKYNARGTMDPRCKNFIGIKRKDRKTVENTQLLKEVRGTSQWAEPNEEI